MDKYETMWKRLTDQLNNIKYNGSNVLSMQSKLHIDEIDNVKCDVRTEIRGKSELNKDGTKNIYMILSISVLFPYGQIYNQYIDNAKKLKTCLESISTLKYDKVLDTFITNKEKNDDYIYDMTKLIKGDNVKYTYDDCCVCLDKTSVKLKCNHYLCRQCENKLKKKNCPYCRNFYALETDSEEEQED